MTFWLASLLLCIINWRTDVASVFILQFSSILQDAYYLVLSIY